MCDCVTNWPQQSVYSYNIQKVFSRIKTNTGNVHYNVTLRLICATIVAVETQ
jgi:hypothetical protein